MKYVDNFIKIRTKIIFLNILYIEKFIYTIYIIKMKLSKGAVESERNVSFIVRSVWVIEILRYIP